MTARPVAGIGGNDPESGPAYPLPLPLLTRRAIPAIECGLHDLAVALDDARTTDLFEIIEEDGPDFDQVPVTIDHRMIETATNFLGALRRRCTRGHGSVSLRQTELTTS